MTAYGWVMEVLGTCIGAWVVWFAYVMCNLSDDGKHETARIVARIEERARQLSKRADGRGK